MKYLGFIARAIPRIIKRYPRVVRNYRHRFDSSFTKRYNDARELIKKVNEALHIKIIVSGMKKLPVERSFLLAPNHQSFMDPLVIIDTLDQQCSFVAKKEVKKYPVVGKVLTSLNGEYIDRSDLRQEMKIMMRVRESLKRDNIKWIVFPEGTRTKDVNHQMGEFKAGSLKMALNAKVSIFPVAIWGTFRIFSKKYKMKRYPVYLHFCNPITPEMYENMTTSEVSDLLRNAIAKELEILKQVDEKRLSEFK